MQLLWGVTPVYVMALMSLMTSGALGRMNQAAKDYILQMHNDYRRTEGASNMAKLKWDNKLEDQAKAWAAGCLFDHKGMGENLYYHWDLKKPEKELIQDAMVAFYNEKLNYTYGDASCGISCHYTQIVWAETTTVGCASRVCEPLRLAATNDPYWYLVCRYEPVGNWDNEKPYQKGQACSACKTKNAPCENGLCVEN